MKKLLCLLLSGIIALTMCGCSEVDAGKISDIASELMSDIDDIYGEFTTEAEKNSDTATVTIADTSPSSSTANAAVIDENGKYYTKTDVAEYIHLYNKLPQNYISKNQAKELGWNSSDGNLWEVAYGMCIGGDKFGNYEGLLPDKSGRKWTECDVNYDGGFRDAQRIIFSNDGLIYFTDDHYESFTQLY